MTPLPKKKHTRSRSKIRRGANKLGVPFLVKCKSCKKPIPPHMVCPYCGANYKKPK